MERTNAESPVWPDAQELKMLRVLVREGVARMAAIRYGLYAVHFRGWRVRVWRHDGALRSPMLVDIRSDAGEVWARFTWEAACPAGDEVAL